MSWNSGYYLFLDLSMADKFSVCKRCFFPSCTWLKTSFNIMWSLTVDRTLSVLQLASESGCWERMCFVLLGSGGKSFLKSDGKLHGECGWLWCITLGAWGSWWMSEARCDLVFLRGVAPCSAFTERSSRSKLSISQTKFLPSHLANSCFEKKHF